MYSRGVFLHSIIKDRKSWKKQADFINSLPDVNHVEVMVEEDLNLADLKFIKSLFKKYEIILHAPFVDLTLISVHQEIREATLKLYLRAFQVAEFLNAKLITFHGGKKLEFMDKKRAVELLAQNLKEIKCHYPENPSFTIENLPPPGKLFNKFFSSFEDLSYLKKHIPWINFTLDIGHAFVSGEDLDKISKFLKRYKNSILDIHLHDAILEGKDHLALGQGDLDLPKFLKILQEINYKKYLTLETLSLKDTKLSWQKLLACRQAN